MGEYQSEFHDPRNYKAWEQDPSTRESLRLLTKPYPVDVTLTTPDTAQNFFTVAPGVPTVNLITNPSIETNTTGWTASGATRTRDATIAYKGSWALLINPANAANNEGAYFNLGLFPSATPLMFSAYFNDNVDSGEQALCLITDSAGNLISSGTTVTLSSAWQRSVCQIGARVLQSPTTLYLYIVTGTQHNIDFWVDGIQAEVRESVSPYCDGAQGAYHWWDGVVHASTSRRWRKLSCIRSYRLQVTRDCYVAYDRVASNTATNPEDKGEFLKAGTEIGEDHPIYLGTGLSFINYWSGEQPRIYGLVWGI